MLIKENFILILIAILIDQISSTNYACESTAVCGCSRQPVVLGRIVGGESATSQTWDWAVSLQINGALCGGSIISSSWVITAAHCVVRASASQITVHAGSIYRLAGAQIRSVSSVKVHPSYNSVSYANDIALLRLSSSLDLTSNGVRPICLPSVSSAQLAQGEWPSPSTTVVSIGWGRLSEDGSVASILQQVTMQAVNRNAPSCSTILNRATVQMCASSPCKDTCQGDSGGPLMSFTTSNQWVLVGLTSYGVGCARPDFAGVYTRIAAFQSWIDSTTNKQFFNASSSDLISSTTEIFSNATCQAPIQYRFTSTFTVVFSICLQWIIKLN